MKELRFVEDDDAEGVERDAEDGDDGADDDEDLAPEFDVIVEREEVVDAGVLRVVFEAKVGVEELGCVGVFVHVVRVGERECDG